MASLTSPCPTAHADAALKTRCDTNVAEHHSKVCGLTDARSVNALLFVNRQLIDKRIAFRAKTNKTAVPERMQNATAPINVGLYVYVCVCTIAH